MATPLKADIKSCSSDVGSRGSGTTHRLLGAFLLLPSLLCSAPNEDWVCQRHPGFQNFLFPPIPQWWLQQFPNPSSDYRLVWYPRPCSPSLSLHSRLGASGGCSLPLDCWVSPAEDGQLRGLPHAWFCPEVGGAGPPTVTCRNHVTQRKWPPKHTV